MATITSDLTVETTAPNTVPSKVGSKVILLAEHAGYCHGVKKSVDKTLKTNETSGKPVYVLGQLIHNQQVIDKLASEGIQTVHSLDEVPPGSVCMIRTHGAPPELVDVAAAQGVQMVDATCPDVSLVQNKAIELVEEGYTVVVVGKHDHPEVIGITAHASRVPGAKVVVLNSPNEVMEKLKGLPIRRVGVVSQTTQLEETYYETVKRISMVAKELKVFNTICPATHFRQNAALELAEKVELMIVIGGKNSSNTTHLAEICKEVGTQAYHVETVAELRVENTDIFKDVLHAKTIGVTAGASTPDWLVEEVLAYLQSL